MVCAIFSYTQVDDVLINLFKYGIDDPDNKVCKVLEVGIVITFNQLCNTPPSDISFLKMDKGKNTFGPIVCTVHNSLANIIFYTRALESTLSNNPNLDDATSWTIDTFSKWIWNNIDAHLASAGAPSPAGAFVFGSPGVGDATVTSTKANQSALETFFCRKLGMEGHL